MNEFVLRPELSAQRRSQTPNPALGAAINFLQGLRGKSGLGRTADLGCGKLRHYAILSGQCTELFLVDTRRQLEVTHRDGDELYTVTEVAERETRAGRKVRAVDITTFEELALELDTVFCIAVFDVVTPEVRALLVSAAERNLKRGGCFVLIIPRNDASILRRTGEANRFLDGFVFPRHGVATFFRNFDKGATIDTIAGAEEQGLRLVRDMSRFRQVCLIFEKT